MSGVMESELSKAQRLFNNAYELSNKTNTKTFRDMSGFKYQIGETVYLKTDCEQLERIVIGISIYPIGIMYQLACGIDQTWHYDIEMSPDGDIIKATS